MSTNERLERIQKTINETGMNINVVTFGYHEALKLCEVMYVMFFCSDGLLTSYNNVVVEKSDSDDELIEGIIEGSMLMLKQFNEIHMKQLQQMDLDRFSQQEALMH